ncbi:MAG: hypothetical protein ABJL55_17115 [Roseibium sp.]
MTVLPSRGLAADNPLDAMRELEAISAIGRTKRPIHHVHVDPPVGRENPELLLRHRELYEAEFGLQDAPSFSVSHEKNGRLHEHRVYTIVQENGRCIDLSWERARREKISRIIEFEFGLPMIAGRHNKAVEKALRQDGRHDVADAIVAAGIIDQPRPEAVSPEERHIAERTGVSARSLDARVLAAWKAADSGPSFRAALEDRGIFVAQGTKTLVVLQDGKPESLNRVLSREAKKQGFGKISAADVKKRLSGLNIPDLADLDRTSTFYRTEKPVECCSGSSVGDPSPENSLVSGKEDFNAEPKTATNEGHSSRRAQGHPGDPGRNQGHQKRHERVDEPARSERNRGRAGSYRSIDRVADRTEHGRESDQNTSGVVGGSPRNKLMSAPIRKRILDQRKSRSQKNVRHKIAAVRLRQKLTPAAIAKIKDSANFKARQKAARRRRAIARLSKIDAPGIRERIASVFRSSEENLGRLLNERQALAEARANESRAEPADLTAARHALTKASVRRGKTFANFQKAIHNLKKHQDTKPPWGYIQAYFAWKKKRDSVRTTADRLKAKDRIAAQNKRDATEKFDALKSAWDKNPEKRFVEKRDATEIFEAKRELALIAEVRRIVREDPARASLKLETLFGVANQQLQKKDEEREIRCQMKLHTPDDDDPGSRFKP